jgi:crossover junction endodeoxyribonuclease RuvC
MTTLAPTRSGLTQPVVVGLDPSLTATGLASSNGWCEAIGYQKARTKDPGITTLPHPSRYQAMREVLHRITQAIGNPALVVMETPAFSRSGGGAHERAWLWWQIYGHLLSREIPVGLMGTGQRCTYATGKGNASKEAVVDAVARRWPAWETGGDNNLADAVVFMAAGRDWLGHPITDMPKTHRAALDKAVWPTLPGATR